MRILEDNDPTEDAKMWWRLVRSVGLWMAASGCVTHRSIQLDPPNQAAVADLAVEVAERTAALKLDTASIAQVMGLRVESDSLLWQTTDGGENGIDAAQVREIEIRKRGRGLAEGVLGGIVVAALAGGVAGFCCEGSPEAWIPPEYAVGVGAALVTIPVGALIGAIRGHRVVYEAR